ncbi:MAG: OmpA family protein [candidate division WOR-3 bacterium]|jgi:chemotaxis protein MotB
MKRDIFYFTFILFLLLLFGFFYVKKHTPLYNSLNEYKEENKTLISIVNDLKGSMQSADTLKKENGTSYLVQDLQDMVEGIEVELEREEISITLPCEKMFPPGTVELSKEGQETLLRIANILKEMPERDIRIEGHTDNVAISGSLKKEYPTNWDLSAKRAVNVVKFLIANVNIEPSRLAAVAFGEYRPVSDNDTEKGRNRNRRIVIDVLPK